MPVSSLQHDLTGATALAPTRSSDRMTVVLMPALRDPSGAISFARAVSTPDDPLYHHFLTSEQFADRFAISKPNYAALTAWAVSNGLSINEQSNGRTTLSLSGSVKSINRALGVTISDYRASDGTVFHAPASDPVLPAFVAQRVTAVLGLSNRTRPRPLATIMRRLDPAAPKPLTAGGTSIGGAYGPADLRTAYDVPVSASPPADQTIAVYEDGGFVASDISIFIAQNKLPNVPVTPRLVNGYGGLVSSPAVALEAALDIDYAIGMNPRVKQVLVYEDGADSFSVSLLDSLTAMANDNVAQTVSISYGVDESAEGSAAIAAEGTVLQQLVAQGTAVFVSAGDGGAYGHGTRRNVEDPGSQPYVTSVGGTTLYTMPGETYYGEQAWNGLGFGDGATGGGVSKVWTIPSYQLVPGTTTSVATANGGSATKRNVPDITMVGDPATGVAIYVELFGGWLQIGGTSASSPIAAGIFSLLSAEYKTVGLGRFGFFNPLVYKTLSGQSPSFFNDILDGSNGNKALFGVAGYNAGPGYDNTSGAGSLQGQNLLLEPFDLQGKVSGAPGPVKDVTATTTTTSIAASWTPTPGATGYLLYGRQQENGSSFSGPVSTRATSGTHATLSNLLPDTLYLIVVIPINDHGPGSTRTPYYVTTAAQ